MKHEILSWNTFTLIKKIVFGERRYLVKFNNIKGTDMQLEKTPINDHLLVSKNFVSWIVSYVYKQKCRAE